MDALIVVDFQRDFLPGGRLAVPGGDLALRSINRLLRFGRFEYVVATRDWHPRDHGSFAGEEVAGWTGIDRPGRWPPHCVQGTAGAELHPELAIEFVDDVVDKGTEREVDLYSAFAETDLAERLRDRGVDRVFIVGLATDYCVLHNALDAATAGFEVVVVEDAVTAVDVTPGDGVRARRRMSDAGCEWLTSIDVVPSESLR